MATMDRDEGAKGPTAPYISFLTVKNVLKDMKEHSPPTRIDRTVFPNLAGGTVGQLLPALKFLKLTDDTGVPTNEMHNLISAHGTEAWGATLEQIVRSAYAPLFKINLEGASPGQFVEIFRKAYPGTEDVSRKSQTFFLNAAREAGIKISPYIMKNKKPRTAPNKKRVPKAAKNTGSGTKNDGHADDLTVHNQNKLPSEILLGLYDTNMDNETQSAIWTLIRYFKAKKE